MRVKCGGKYSVVDRNKVDALKFEWDKPASNPANFPVNLKACWFFAHFSKL